MIIKNKEQNKGFTLIEVLVSAALMVILATGFLGLQYLLSKNQTSTWQNYKSIEAANSSVSSMSREIRNMHNSEIGSYPLDTANDQSIVFYSDFDLDGVVERMRYTLSGTELRRGITEPIGNPYTYNVANEKVKVMTDIVRNGTGPVFYYYNTNWPEDTTNNPVALANRISQTREIKIVLITNPKANDPDHDYKIESNVKVRMFNQQ